LSKGYAQRISISSLIGSEQEEPVEGNDQKKRIAVACHGGGSHTAFTAGALKKLLTRGQARYDFVAFSGTSGGAICALLAWYGSLTGSPEKAVDLLDVFWKRDNSANTSPERIFQRLAR